MKKFKFIFLVSLLIYGLIWAIFYIIQTPKYKVNVEETQQCDNGRLAVVDKTGQVTMYLLDELSHSIPCRNM